MKKVCTRCKAERAIDEYRKSKDCAGGLHPECKQCSRERRDEWMRKHPGAASEYMKRYREKHRDAVNSRASERRAKNPEKTRAQSRRSRQLHKAQKLAYAREYRQARPEIYRAASSTWSKKNPEKVRANLSRRNAAKAGATPRWAERDRIALVYEKAAQFAFEVDHVVPLRSKIVCGLHVWANLQLLDRKANTSKGNRHWPDMPDESAPASGRSSAR